MFPLDRMLAIFGAISGRPSESHSSETYAQVGSLAKNDSNCEGYAACVNETSHTSFCSEYIR